MALTKKAAPKKMRRSKPVTPIVVDTDTSEKSAVVVIDKATAPYEGELPESITHHRDNLYLVPVEDRPDDPAFPKLEKGCYPPETYYVFDCVTKRCEHMYSIDAQDVGIAWDVDYGGRYFTRVTKPLRCPRFVEWAYDSSNAIVNAEGWNRGHPNYLGSLSSNVGGSDAQPDHRQAPRAKRALPGKLAGKTTASVSTKTTTPTVAAPTAPKKSLAKRKTLRKQPVEKSTLLTDKGLDTRALDNEAKNMSEKLAAAFGSSGSSSTAKKPLKKKTLRRKG